MKKIFLLLISISLLSCSSDRGLFQLMPNEISDVSTFFKVWISIFIINLFVYSFLRHFATILLFILVLIFKDYGFWMTVLIFTVDAIVIYLFLLIRIYLSSKR